MNCGEEITVHDPMAVVAARFLFGCNGVVMITEQLMLPKDIQRRTFNGMRIGDWRGVLRELVALAGHATDQMWWTAQRAGSRGQVRLTRNMRASELAELLAEAASEVRKELHDYLIVPPPAEGDHVGQ